MSTGSSMSQDDVRVSPDLIAQLNALASRLTEQGEYEAVDLIDTVVARVTAMPQRELLAEALEALDRQRVWHEGHDKTLSKQPPNTDVRWRRLEHQEQAEDARAAADKIRAALEHQP